MAEYFKGDLSNKHHVNSIIKMVDKYNFYNEDIYFSLTGKLHPSLKSKLPPFILKQTLQLMTDFAKGHVNNFIVVKPKDNMGRIIGFIFWDYNSAPTHNGCCSIHYLFVLPEYRNQGIATTLIQKFNKWCEENGRMTADVDFDIKDTHLITFYKKFGFRYIPLISEKNIKTRNLITLYKSDKQTTDEIECLVKEAVLTALKNH